MNRRLEKNQQILTQGGEPRMSASLRLGAARVLDKPVDLEHLISSARALAPPTPKL